MLDAAQVVVHEVVAPAVQLVRGLRRAVGEGEERAVERVSSGSFASVSGPGKMRRISRLERRRVEPGDVVVAVVGEEQPAVLDEPGGAARARASLKRTSLWPVMNRNGNAASSSESAVMTTSSRVDRDGGVLDERVEHVGGDLGVVVPVAGVVAQPREDELDARAAGRGRRPARAARRHAPRQRPTPAHRQRHRGPRTAASSGPWP